MLEDYNLKDNFKNLDNEDAYYNLITKEEFNKIKIMPNILKEIISLDNFKHYIVDDLNNNNY